MPNPCTANGACLGPSVPSHTQEPVPGWPDRIADHLVKLQAKRSPSLNGGRQGCSAASESAEGGAVIATGPGCPIGAVEVGSGGPAVGQQWLLTLLMEAITLAGTAGKRTQVYCLVYSPLVSLGAGALERWPSTRCPHGGLVLGRDENAALNILAAALGEPGTVPPGRRERVPVRRNKSLLGRSPRRAVFARARGTRAG
jgi:hypothetical protein